VSLNEKTAVIANDKNTLKNLSRVRRIDVQNMIVHQFRRANCSFI